MSPIAAIKRLNEQIHLIDVVSNGGYDSPEFIKWRTESEYLIERMFGPTSTTLSEFQRYSRASDLEFRETFKKVIQSTRPILATIITQMIDIASEKQDPVIPVEHLLRTICDRFEQVSVTLQRRHAGRSTIKIFDEYDVQDLLHAILRLYFDDVRPEEWTGSYAGGSSRIDFLLKKQEFAIEVKMTRDGLGARQIGDELLIDIQRYQAHKACKSLVCFVYDPSHRIINPTGLEADLSRVYDGRISVLVLVRPR